MSDKDAIVSGKIEKIGFYRSLISLKTKSGSENLDDIHIADHKEGLNFIIDNLTITNFNLNLLVLVIGIYTDINRFKSYNLRSL